MGFSIKIKFGLMSNSDDIPLGASQGLLCVRGWDSVLYSECKSLNNSDKAIMPDSSRRFHVGA